MLARLSLVLLLLLAPAAHAAQQRPGHVPDPDAALAIDQPPVAAGEEAGVQALDQRWHQPVEIAFSLAVLAFGFALIVLFTRAIGPPGGPWRSVYLRLVVLTIVVTAGLFVVVAGYTQDQIAPMMGLLGTLVGYLLGRESSAPQSDDSKASRSG